MDTHPSLSAPMALDDLEDIGQVIPLVHAPPLSQVETPAPHQVEAGVPPQVQARAPMGFFVITGMQAYPGMEPYMSLKVLSLIIKPL